MISDLRLFFMLENNQPQTVRQTITLVLVKNNEYFIVIEQL